MANDNPSLEEALDYVMKAIGAGAHPWTIEEAVFNELRNEYRDGFKKQLERPGSWEQESPKLLRLAKYQGAFAALIAEVFMPAGGQPSTIDRDFVIIASRAVRAGCPVDANGLFKPLGHWCPRLSFMPDPTKLQQLGTKVQLMMAGGGNPQPS